MVFASCDLLATLISLCNILNNSWISLDWLMARESNESSKLSVSSRCFCTRPAINIHSLSVVVSVVCESRLIKWTEGKWEHEFCTRHEIKTNAVSMATLAHVTTKRTRKERERERECVWCMSALWLCFCFVLVVLESWIGNAIASTNGAYAMPSLTTSPSLHASFPSHS